MGGKNTKRSALQLTKWENEKWVGYSSWAEELRLIVGYCYSFTPLWMNQACFLLPLNSEELILLGLTKPTSKDWWWRNEAKFCLLWSAWSFCQNLPGETKNQHSPVRVGILVGSALPENALQENLPPSFAVFWCRTKPDGWRANLPVST